MGFSYQEQTDLSCPLLNLQTLVMQLSRSTNEATEERFHWEISPGVMSPKGTLCQNYESARTTDRPVTAHTLATFFSPSWWGGHDCQSVRKLGTCHLLSGSEDGRHAWMSLFLMLCSSGPQPIVQATLRVSLSSLAMTSLTRSGICFLNECKSRLMTE